MGKIQMRHKSVFFRLLACFYVQFGFSFMTDTRELQMDLGVDHANDVPSTDQTLLKRLESGDEDAATILYQRYARRLLALVRKKTSDEFATRFDAEDVIQSVFRTFFRRARSGGYTVPESGELWQLLLVLSLNKICDLAVYHRAQKRDIRVSIPATTSLADHNLDDGGLALAILRLTIDDTLRDLLPVQREIITDRINGYEVAEIAQRVSRSKRTVERSLQRFRQRLNSIISDEG